MYLLWRSLINRRSWCTRRMFKGIIRPYCLGGWNEPVYPIKIHNWVTRHIMCRFLEDTRYSVAVEHSRKHYSWSSQPCNMGSTPVKLWLRRPPMNRAPSRLRQWPQRCRFLGSVTLCAPPARQRSVTCTTSTALSLRVWQGVGDASTSHCHDLAKRRNYQVEISNRPQHVMAIYTIRC